jgi:hypothetical protein
MYKPYRVAVMQDTPIQHIMDRSANPVHVLSGPKFLTYKLAHEYLKTVNPDRKPVIVDIT